jgi:hypothetical protein
MTEDISVKKIKRWKPLSKRQIGRPKTCWEDDVLEDIGCPTTYQTRNFFNNSKTNEDIATKQTLTTDTFLFISHTTNVLLFKSLCNIFIGFRIIKEMPGLVGIGTPCIKNMNVRNWKNVAQNRDRWKKVVEQARTLNRL